MSDSVRGRHRELCAAATAASAEALFDTGHSMLDCPAHNQTSPTRTSLTVSDSAPERTSIVSGRADAWRAGRVTRRLPSSLATVFCRASPAHPHDHRLPRAGLSPDRQVDISLHNHVVGQRSSELQLRDGFRGGRADQRGQLMLITSLASVAGLGSRLVKPARTAQTSQKSCLSASVSASVGI